MRMDGGPFSVQRPTDRAATNRPEPTHRQPEELQSVNDEPKPVHRAAPSRHTPKEEKSSKRFLKPLIISIIILILVAVGWFAWTKTQNVATAIDTSKYQAVFFTNGQVYFGKLQPFNEGNMKLTDIYYLQSSTADTKDSKNPQETSADQSNVQLIKLGDEIHGPEDMMIISKDQVLFYENLKTDGKVAQSIQKYKTK